MCKILRHSFTDPISEMSVWFWALKNTIKSQDYTGRTRQVCDNHLFIWYPHTVLVVMCFLSTKTDVGFSTARRYLSLAKKIYCYEKGILLSQLTEFLSPLQLELVKWEAHCIALHCYGGFALIMITRKHFARRVHKISWMYFWTAGGSSTSQRGLIVMKYTVFSS